MICAKAECITRIGQVHRALMGCVWLLTITAFVLIFIANEGWGPSKDNEMAHGVIGCIVTGNPTFTVLLTVTDISGLGQVSRSCSR